jgi:hypothetical protein
MVLPLVLFVVMWSMPRMLRPATALAPYAVLLGIAAVAAAVSPASYNERHADPVILAFVLGWSYLMFGPGDSRGRLAWPFLLLLLFVALSSGYRSSLAMWFLIGLMVQFLSRGARTVLRPDPGGGAARATRRDASRHPGRRRGRPLPREP